MTMPKNISSGIGLDFAISTRRKERMINQINEYTGKITAYLRK